MRALLVGLGALVLVAAALLVAGVLVLAGLGLGLVAAGRALRTGR